MATKTAVRRANSNGTYAESFAIFKGIFLLALSSTRRISAIE